MSIGAQSYLKVVEVLQGNILTDDIIKTVTRGDITEVDLDKQSIYPLAHIIVNNVSFGDFIVTYNVSVLFMDIVYRDEATSEPLIYQNDNEMYVLNTMLNAANRMVDDFNVGDLNNGDYYIDKNTVTAEPFMDRFEDLVAGFAVTFDMQVRNNIDRCN